MPWTELILGHRRFLNDLNTDTSGRTSVLLVFLLVTSSLLWQPLALASAGVFALTLLILNVPLYRFFLRKGGIRFAIQSIPFHWLYFSYSGVAFAAGALRRIATSDGLHKSRFANAEPPMEGR